MHYVLLDPDGSVSLGLALLVDAATGVLYEHQCAGLATEPRVLEGFLIPLADAPAAQPFHAFFHDKAAEPCWSAGSTWSADRVDALAALVAGVRCYHHSEPGRDPLVEWLALDRDRLGELTEGWIPVTSPYGPGVLFHDNCD